MREKTGGEALHNVEPAAAPPELHFVAPRIVQTITGITNANAATQALQRTQTAIYLIATSAQYQVER